MCNVPFSNAAAVSWVQGMLVSVHIFGQKQAIEQSHAQRLFMRNFPCAAQFFFVCELSGRTNRKKEKK